MSEATERPTGRPCEDCGALVVEGPEPLAPANDNAGTMHTGVLMVRSEWCTAPNCPSNHALAGLHRVGVNRYVCTVCRDVLTGPMSSILDHQRAH
jgi:hypothetical protein